jgi:hypothetical protein
MTDMRPGSAFAGSIIYRPRFPLSEAMLRQLADVLVKETHVEEPENPMVSVDWFCNNADGPPYVVREGVALYRDGGDAEEPAVLFYRFPLHTTGMDTLPAVHVPPENEQAALAKAALDPWASNMAGLTLLYGYLSTILNDPVAWVPLPFVLE